MENTGKRVVCGTTSASKMNMDMFGSEKIGYWCGAALALINKFQYCPHHASSGGGDALRGPKPEGQS